MKTAVFLFDYTGNMAKPWLDAGYKCYLVDIQHKEGMFADTENPNLIRVGADLLNGVPLLVPPKPDFVSCFPPCTDVSISGARWFAGKGLRALAQSIEMFATCTEYCESTEAPYMIENPMSTISTYWRPPDHKFHPCQYAGYHIDDNYTKETWLWTGGGFVMPPMDMPLDLEIDETYIHYQSPGEERANIRSATPMGFSLAVFQQHGENND